MTDDPFENPHALIRQELEQHRRRMAAELEAARRKMRTAMDLARAELEAARFQFELKMADFRSDIAGYEEDWTEMPRRNRGQKRPRRRPGGGSPAPVGPGPRPTPRVGGAEAPLE